MVSAHRRTNPITWRRQEPPPVRGAGSGSLDRRLGPKGAVGEHWHRRRARRRSNRLAAWNRRRITERGSGSGGREA